MPSTSSPDVAPALSTERLQLRPFSSENAEALHAVFVDPGVRRYLLDDQVVERDWVEKEIADSAARFEGGSLGLWSVARTGAGAVIGFVGFREFFEPPQLQLLYGLLPSAWGEGLATEAAAAVVRYAFVEVGVSQIVAATDLPNRASERVMRRLGMSFLEVIANRGQPTLFYRLSRSS
jgi:ribosomal-protein-alanine N-acetyltransferase